MAVAHSGTSPKIRCCCTWDRPKYLADHEEKAWKLDSLTTLKTIACLRMMENPNKEAFYQSLLWVHKNHPKTLALNVMVLKRVLEESISSNYDHDEKKTEADDDISKARIAIERVRNCLGDQVLIPLREAIGKVKKPSSKTDNTLIALETYSKIFSPGSKEEEGIVVLFHHCMKLIQLFSPKGNMVDMFGNLSIGNESNKLPHQIVASLFKKEKVKRRETCGDEVAELEWMGLVQEFATQGKLKNCVAVCDMRPSKTAAWDFKEAASISIGLLISELSENPWKGNIFSFREFPKLKKIEGDDLRSKCEFISQMECTEKVNFGAIYSRILQISLTEKISKEQMPKRIFVFTYNDFVTASKNNWNEEYKEAWASYRKRGLTVPKMVFWNLKDPIAEPKVFGSPVKNQNGGMIMTGFSNLLLKLFFRGDMDSRSNAGQSHAFYHGVNVPLVMKFVPKVEHVMNCALSREELNNLVVLD